MAPSRVDVRCSFKRIISFLILLFTVPHTVSSKGDLRDHDRFVLLPVFRINDVDMSWWPYADIILQQCVSQHQSAHDTREAISAVGRCRQESVLQSLTVYAANMHNLDTHPHKVETSSLFLGPCGRMHMVHFPTFYDHGDFTGNVITYLKHSYIIHVQRNFRLNITFTKFDLPYSNVWCTFGRLIIEEYDTKLCGNYRPFSVISKSNIFRFSFELESFLAADVDCEYTITGRRFLSRVRKITVEAESPRKTELNLDRPILKLASYNISMFYLQTDVDSIFRLTVEVELCENVFIYDGPGILAERLACTSNSRSLASEINTSTFQAFIMYHMPSTNNPRSAVIVYNREASSVIISNIRLEPNELLSISNQTTQDKGGVAIYSISCPLGHYVRLNIMHFDFEGPGIGMCKFGGLQLLDPESPEYGFIGAFCGRDPLTASNLLHLQEGIISSSNKLLLVLYSYQGYSSFSIQATLSASSCMGVINPCAQNVIFDTFFDPPTPVALFYIPENFPIYDEPFGVNSTRCFYLQQYPPYLYLHSEEAKTFGARP